MDCVNLSELFIYLAFFKLYFDGFYNLQLQTLSYVVFNAK